MKPKRGGRGLFAFASIRAGDIQRLLSCARSTSRHLSVLSKVVIHASSRYGG